VRFTKGTHASWKSKVEAEISWEFDEPWLSKLYSNISGDIYLQSVTEVTDQQPPRFPGIATVGINAAVHSMTSAITRVTALVEGALVYVDSSIDSSLPPVFGYSRNPAMCTRDWCQHPEGLGLAAENINRQKFWDWMKTCDETIPYAGGTIKRHELGYVVDGQRSAADHLVIMSAAGNAQPVWDGSVMTPSVDEEVLPTQVFSIFGMGNITGFARYPIGTENRPNAVQIEFRDETNDFRLAHQSSHDHDRIGEEGELRLERMEGWGMTHPARVHREAVKQKNYAKYTKWILELGAGQEAVVCRPGDIIGCHHQIPYWGGISGRVKGSTATQVQLEQDLTIEAGIPSPMVGVMTMGTGTPVWQTRSVVEAPGTYVAGTFIDISPSWDGGDPPLDDDMYVCGQDQGNGLGPALLYRVIKVDGDKHQNVQLTLTNFDKRVYEYPDEEAPAPVPKEKRVTPETIPARPDPTTFQHRVERKGQNYTSGVANLFVRLSWANAPWDYKFENSIYCKVPAVSDEWFRVGQTFDQHFEYAEVVEGWDYVFAVSPMAPASDLHRNALVCPQHEVRVRRVGVSPPAVPSV
jgi:hypothetical protein